MAPIGFGLIVELGLTRRRAAHSMKSCEPYIDAVEKYVREHPQREDDVEDERLRDCALLSYDFTRAHTHLAHAHGRLQLLGVALGARVGNKRIQRMRMKMSEQYENDDSDSEDDLELGSET